jgi:hypothetical protein
MSGALRGLNEIRVGFTTACWLGFGTRFGAVRGLDWAVLRTAVYAPLLLRFRRLTVTAALAFCTRAGLIGRRWRPSRRTLTSRRTRRNKLVTKIRP